MKNAFTNCNCWPLQELRSNSAARNEAGPTIRQVSGIRGVEVRETGLRNYISIRKIQGALR